MVHIVGPPAACATPRLLSIAGVLLYGWHAPSTAAVTAVTVIAEQSPTCVHGVSWWQLR